jgi:hypothetical protein
MRFQPSSITHREVCLNALEGTAEGFSNLVEFEEPFCARVQWCAPPHTKKSTTWRYSYFSAATEFILDARLAGYSPASRLTAIGKSNENRIRSLVKIGSVVDVPLLIGRPPIGSIPPMR